MRNLRKALSFVLAAAALTYGVNASATTFNPVGYDIKHHMTLNGIPVGVRLDDVMPACKSDRKTSKALCHGPVSGKYATVDVLGYSEGETSDGKPLVTSMWVAMDIDGTTIEMVYARIEPSAALPALFALQDGLGMPSSMDTTLGAVQWQTSDTYAFLWSARKAPIISIQTKN